MKGVLIMHKWQYLLSILLSTVLLLSVHQNAEGTVGNNEEYISENASSIISVVIPDPEFFPSVDPVDLFSEGLILRIVKIQAAYQVFSVNGMRILLHHRTQAGTQCKHVTVSQNMFPFMSVTSFFHDSYLPFFFRVSFTVLSYLHTNLI